jgi:hypothetical protein
MVTTKGPVSGTVQSQVVKSIDGTYDFYWRVTSDDASFAGIHDFSVYSSFAGASIAGWRSDLASGVRPSFIWSGPEGGTRWLFLTPASGVGVGAIEAGTSSAFIFLDTDARFYDRTGSFQVTTDFVRDAGGVSGTSDLYQTFAPAVPEPQTYVLMVAGLALLGALGKSRIGSARRR